MFVKFRIVFCKKYVNLIFSKVFPPCYEVHFLNYRIPKEFPIMIRVSKDTFVDI